MLRPIPYMGVIYVVAEAMKLGFHNGHPDWCNLGQGQPEIGPMEGAPERLSTVDLEPSDHAYGPIGGTQAMRECVAAHYNRLYRRGKQPYTADNVSVVAGGRLALTRCFAALAEGRLGYQIPDYTAYEDMMGYHMHRVEPVLVETFPEDGFAISPERFEATVAEGLSAYILSNPCNPTGQVIQGEHLASFVGTARRHRCTLILDEFYSHFIYTPDGRPGAGPVSAAAYVEDVDADPVLIIDGLTKSFRYPGWRVGWVVGPREMIEILGRAASAIDGGPPQPMQRLAQVVLEPQRADQETSALRRVFARKRRLVLDVLGGLGVRFPHDCEGTFYAWGSLAELPEPFNNADFFFREALKRRVMTVPGHFFDVNPGQGRSESRYRQWMRFSFGPPEHNVRMGLDRLTEMLRA